MNDPTLCSTVDDEKFDYTKGEPRPHHSFYFPDGSFVFQVEKAIFKVSGHLLSKHSSVIRDMFRIPQEGTNQDGTDEKPVILGGDSVKGWEIFLTLLYPDDLLEPVDIYSGSKLDSLFPIVLKYSIESVEKAVLKHLDVAEGTHDAVSLMRVSQMLNSEQLYEKARTKLVRHVEHLQIEDAKRIGVSAVYEIMLGRYNAKSSISHISQDAECNTCGHTNTIELRERCTFCGTLGSVWI
ncbi:hypothetical protein CPB86DRAFT_782779 [Serendipita vermifera]|nr:hypothetical protein CPB86DRAFT_782779 [Serendipita vermifera]